MNEESTHVTLACPHCGQTIETTLGDIEISPTVTCGTCGQEFPAEAIPVIEEESE